MKKIYALSVIFILAFSFASKDFAEINSQQEFLLEPFSIELPKHIRDSFDISFLIVDLKYNGNNVKILELGNMIVSSLSGHGYAWDEGVIWQRFYDYFQTFGLELWCIGGRFNPEKAIFRFFERLTSLGAFRKNNSNDLKNDPYFKKLCSSSKTSKYSKIKDHKGVLAFARYSAKKRKNKNLKKDFDGFLFLNDVAYDFANNKLKTAMLFDNKELAEFKPKWKAYKKQYSKELVEKIKSDFNSDILVIKPLTASCGKGVIMVYKKDLDQTLKTIFTKKNKISKMDESYSYWARDRNNKFLVESFEKSKASTINGQEYDPKMRVVYVLSCDRRIISLKFLGSYWLCPLKSISEGITLTEKYKANVTYEDGVIRVSDEDAKHIQEILSYVLPKMYINMLEVSQKET